MAPSWYGVCNAVDDEESTARSTARLASARCPPRWRGHPARLLANHEVRRMRAAPVPVLPGRVRRGFQRQPYLPVPAGGVRRWRRRLLRVRGLDLQPGCRLQRGAHLSAGPDGPLQRRRWHCVPCRREPHLPAGTPGVRRSASVPRRLPRPRARGARGRAERPMHGGPCVRLGLLRRLPLGRRRPRLLRAKRHWLRAGGVRRGVHARERHRGEMRCLSAARVDLFSLRRSPHVAQTSRPSASRRSSRRTGLLSTSSIPHSMQ